MLFGALMFNDKYVPLKTIFFSMAHHQFCPLFTIFRDEPDDIFIAVFYSFQTTFTAKKNSLNKFFSIIQ